MNRRVVQHLTRRRLVNALGATTAALAFNSFATAQAEQSKPAMIAPRGHTGILRRLPDLDVESVHDFLKGMKVWSLGELSRIADKRATVIFKERGLDSDVPLPLSEVVSILEADPILATTGKAFMDIQRVKTRALIKTFLDHADEYLAELERFDKAGPGSLELNPGMAIDPYCRHEIHTMPGGYCGNPLAGYFYHYGTLVMTTDRDAQDQTYDGFAAAMPVPADGKVRRILDLGTGIGQLATSLKKRFPEAEVWGIDVGAPMLRYAHMKAIDMGRYVHFAQRAAEDSKFTANSFDLITSRIMFHEVTANASRAIIREVERVLRPGGVFYPMDVYTANKVPTGAFERYRDWWIHRWNNEVWWYDYATLDFNGEMRKAGLAVNENGPSPNWQDVMRLGMGRGVPNVMATKV